MNLTFLVENMLHITMASALHNVW